MAQPMNDDDVLNAIFDPEMPSGGNLEADTVSAEEPDEQEQAFLAKVSLRACRPHLDSYALT